MTSVFSWQNSIQPLPCFILYSKAKFDCYSRCFLTYYFCIPVHYNEKVIFLGVSSRKSCRSSQNHSTSASVALLVRAQTVAVHSWYLLREVTIIFITSTIVWPQVNSREGTQLYPSTENWIKVLLSMALPIRTRTSFPLSQSLPSGTFHKPLILLHQRADRLKTTITEN